MQITGETSDGTNEYGFFYEKRYYSNDSKMGFIFHEDGSATLFSNSSEGYTPGQKINGFSYSDKMAAEPHAGQQMTFSSDGKTATFQGNHYEIID